MRTCGGYRWAAHQPWPRALGGTRRRAVRALGSRVNVSPGLQKRGSDTGLVVSDLAPLAASIDDAQPDRRLVVPDQPALHRSEGAEPNGRRLDDGMQDLANFVSRTSVYAVGPRGVYEVRSRPATKMLRHLPWISA